MKSTSLLVIALLLGVTAGARAETPAAAGALAVPDAVAPHSAAIEAVKPAAQAPPAVEAAEPMTKRLDALYAVRDQGSAAKEIDLLLGEALKASPDEPEVLWRAARWHFWQGEVATQTKARERLTKRGWDFGIQALKKAPDDIDVRYWTAVNIGTYADTIGVVSALTRGVEGRFRENLDFVVERKSGHDYGGPLVTLGRYYFKLPWPKHDGKKAIATLRQALKAHPDNLRARVYLAEVLLDEDKKNVKEAATLLEEVLAAKPGRYDAPEERYSQRLAKELKTRNEEALK